RQRETAPHQEAVSRIGEARRTVARRRVIDALDHALGAAIGQLVEQPAIAAREIDRLDQADVDPVGDATVRPARPMRKVDDRLVARMRRVEVAERRRLEALIGPDVSERGATERRLRALADIEAQDTARRLLHVKLPREATRTFPA